MKNCKLALISLAIALLSYIAYAQPNNSESPTVVSAVAAIYPPIAQAAKVTADVFVNVEIDKNGKVTYVKAENGHPLLQRVSEDAARQWLFVPASNGEPKRSARLTFSFILMPEKTPYFDATPVFYPPYKIEIRAIKVVVNDINIP